MIWISAGVLEQLTRDFTKMLLLENTRCLRNVHRWRAKLYLLTAIDFNQATNETYTTTLTSP